MSYSVQRRPIDEFLTDEELIRYHGLPAGTTVLPVPRYASPWKSRSHSMPMLASSPRRKSTTPSPASKNGTPPGARSSSSSPCSLPTP